MSTLQSAGVKLPSNLGCIDFSSLGRRLERYKGEPGSSHEWLRALIDELLRKLSQ
jgi:hypothetical protein